jgi:ATP-dependent DNA helicase RecQ
MNSLARINVLDRLPALVAIDLEVCPHSARIKAIGAVRSGQDPPLEWRGTDPRDGVEQLLRYVGGAGLLVGHNLRQFDLAHLAATLPDAKPIDLPHIDSLWLSALAWPEPKTLRLKKIARDGKLGAAQPNDPVADAKASLNLTMEALSALAGSWAQTPDLADAIHGLARDHDALSHGTVFSLLRGCPAPSHGERDGAILRLSEGRVCAAQADRLLQLARDGDPSLPFLLTRIASDQPGAGLSPWVRKRFPMAGEMLEALRGQVCGKQNCAWCRGRGDSKAALMRWFGYDAFRPEPTTQQGVPMQQAIVDALAVREDVLGILPTGTGKSVCYQLPALERHAAVDHLTVVISPLVALMADQREGLLKKHNVDSCVAINGSLSPLHRQEALEQVIYGDASLLLIAPEQLRNQAIRNALDARRVGLWVFDEAHCISKWGHDFRPDYRYAVRCLGEINADQPAPQVLCVTATAKQSVIADIRDQITKVTRRRMRLFDGGAARTNLTFGAAPVTKMSKLGTVTEAVANQRGDGASLVYCATRKETERMAEAFAAIPLDAAAYHAGLGRAARQQVLDDYLSGRLSTIAATNAFGMGVDKDNIRQVLHADVPASLENYLQEAGRAGRDGAPALCHLFFDPAEIEGHFQRHAQNRLTRREIARVLKALREMAQRYTSDGEIIVSVDDLMRRAGIPSGHEGAGRTRVMTAIAWLEEAGLLTRGANRVTVEPSCLRVTSIGEAERKLRANGVSGPRLNTAMALLTVLLEAPPSHAFTIEDLGDLISRPGWQVRQLLRDLDAMGLVARDTNLVVHIGHGVQNPVAERLADMAQFERTLIDVLADDLATAPPTGVVINLRRLAQDLRDQGRTGHRPDQVIRLLRALAMDGRRDLDDMPPLQVRQVDRERIHLTLNGPVEALREASRCRQSVASLIVKELTRRLEKGARGAALPVPVALTELYDLLEQDLDIRSRIPGLTPRHVDRALLWMHALDVLFVGSGLFLFAPAITVRLSEDTRSFTETDFKPLAEHYTECTRQVHIMSRYGELALGDVDRAQDLVKDYFAMDTRPFVSRWLPDMKLPETERPVRPEHYRRIVDDLKARDQIDIVADDRQESNVLVLAGPGSGKTRVLVHRIAYLLSVKREDPAGILALAYNQHAAHEIRTRLRALVGDTARGVTVRTCHGLALWLTGRSFAGARPEGDDFRAILRDASRMMREDAAAKESLLEGYRWILVDEYQDIGADEYALVSGIAGLARSDPDSRRTLFAVGDDDQAIYGFNGASVKYIRQFQDDFRARPTYLTQNYRSTGHIIDAANHVIAPGRTRMKTDHPIRIDAARATLPPGGPVSDRDPVSQGRVQVLTGTASPRDQALVAVSELHRLARVLDDWSWGRVAVIAREWASLDPVRSYCESHAIPVSDRREAKVRPHIWQLLEYHRLSRWLDGLKSPMVAIREVQDWIARQGRGPIWHCLHDLVARMEVDFGVAEVSVKDALDWIGDWGRDYGGASGGLVLTTAHSAKGLEFDHVVVLDDAWRARPKDDPEELRRLFYVAMTRARHSVAIIEGQQPHAMLPQGNLPGAFLRRPAVVPDVPVEATDRLYRVAGKHDLVHSYGAWVRDDGAAFSAMRAARTGDAVRLVRDTRHDRRGWVLKNADGAMIGRMAKRYEPPPGYVCDRARIAWIKAARSDPSQDMSDHPAHLRDEWPVIMPEFVFRPSTHGTTPRQGSFAF